MSNVTEEGVMDVKSRACDKLLQARVDQRVVGKKVNDVMNRLQVFQPQARDAEVREAFIPESVKQAKARGEIGSKDHKAKVRCLRTMLRILLARFFHAFTLTLFETRFAHRFWSSLAVIARKDRIRNHQGRRRHRR